MAKVGQEFMLDVTDTNGETHYLIVSLEEAQSLYNELGNILTVPAGVQVGVGGMLTTTGVRASGAIDIARTVMGTNE